MGWPSKEALTLLSRKCRGRLSPEEVGLTHASLRNYGHP